MGPLVAPLIAAGGQLLGNVFNALGIKSANEKQREQNLEMYRLQRADALSDWNMMNQYNSPKEQMERLKEAGLNPHLVYGNGVVGNSSSSVRSSSAEGAKVLPKQFDIGAISSAYLNAKFQQTQTDNLEQLIKLNKQKEITEAIKGAQIAANSELSKFNLEMKKRLADVTMKTAGQNLANLEQKWNIGEWDIANKKSQISIRASEYDLHKEALAIKKARNVADLEKIAEDILRSQSTREVNKARIAQIDAAIENIRSGTYLLDQKGQTESENRQTVIKRREMLQKQIDWYDAQNVMHGVKVIIDGASNLGKWRQGSQRIDQGQQKIDMQRERMNW